MAKLFSAENPNINFAVQWPREARREPPTHTHTYIYTNTHTHTQTYTYIYIYICRPNYIDLVTVHLHKQLNKPDDLGFQTHQLIHEAQF